MAILDKGESGYKHVAITPADDADLTNPVRRIYVGATGTVKFTDLAGTTVTWVGLPAGAYIDCAAKRVWDTDTSASSLVGIYE